MTFHEIINVILVHRNKILKVTILTSFFLFLILYFIYPSTFNSHVTVLPPENKSQMGSLGSLLGGNDLSGLLTGGLSNANSQLYREILKSRSAAEYVVRKHNLVEYLDSKNEVEAARKLSDKLNVEINKEGILTLSVDVTTTLAPMIFDDLDSVKRFSAVLSNSYIEALDKINREKLTSKAKRARLYIEEQLKITRNKLDSVETALMTFQEKNKTISLPEQVTAAIESAAKLKSEIIKTEIEIGLLRTNLSEDSRELQSLIKKQRQLQAQYDKLDTGNQDYLLAFREVPELGKQMATIWREVKIQNEVYMLLQQQYYKEKIQENRDLPTVDVLDSAIPPTRKSSPKVISSTISGGMFIFLLMSLIVIVLERKTLLYKRNANKHEEKSV
jgi:tyrosine-protein kinase Etk/Wzc